MKGERERRKEKQTPLFILLFPDQSTEKGRLLFDIKVFICNIFMRTEENFYGQIMRDNVKVVKKSIVHT